MKTYLALDIADEKFHLFRCVMCLSVSFSMKKRKFKAELISDGSDTAKTNGFNTQRENKRKH